MENDMAIQKIKLIFDQQIFCKKSTQEFFENDEGEVLQKLVNGCNTPVFLYKFLVAVEKNSKLEFI